MKKRNMKMKEIDELLKKAMLQISIILAHDIKIGDVVRLKSGGPAMTVQSIEEGKIWVAWFAGEAISRGCFPLAALDLER